MGLWPGIDMAGALWARHGMMAEREWSPIYGLFVMGVDMGTMVCIMVAIGQLQHNVREALWHTIQHAITSATAWGSPMSTLRHATSATCTLARAPTRTLMGRSWHSTMIGSAWFALTVGCGPSTVSRRERSHGGFHLDLPCVRHCVPRPVLPVDVRYGSRGGYRRVIVEDAIMSTWHQDRRPVQLYDVTQWTVVIDPPHQMRALYRASTKELAEVYLRGLKANNPGVARHAYILGPSGK